MNIPSPRRVLRHLFVDDSYNDYYSANIWEKKYREDGFDCALNVPEEDARYGALVALLRRYDHGGPVLDAGCGDGLLWEWYRPFSKSLLVGIDYAPAAIEKAVARNIPNTQFAASDYHGYIHPEACSVVVLNEALYYSGQYMEVVAALERMLKPDGVLVISMWDTLVTRRIWRKLATWSRAIQAVRVSDEGSKRQWRIAVFPRQPKA